MKRFLPVILLVLVAGAGILFVIASQAQYSPQQAALSAYLRYYSTQAHGITVKAIVKAARPDRFTAGMSGPVIGQSPYYRTDVSYAGGSRMDEALRPVPYPPLEMSCVLIGAEQGDTVVFVAMHQDMYNADWLVHQARAAWPGDELNAQLATVGCDFPANLE